MRELNEEKRTATQGKVALTYSYRETRKRVIGKQHRPRSDPHNVASDQGLHCLLAGISIKNRIKATM